MQENLAPAGQLSDRLDGVSKAGGAGQMGERDHARARAEGFLDAGDQLLGRPRRNGHWNTSDYQGVTPGAKLPALIVRGMVVVGDKDLVSWLEVDSADDEIGPFAGV